MAASLSLHADEYRSGARQRPHWHDELHLSLVLSGGVAETVGGVTVDAGPLSVVAKDAGVSHANHFGPPSTRMARLSLSGGTVGGLIDDPTRCPSWRWTHDATVARPFLRLVRRAQGSPAEFGAEDPDLVDLLAAFTARPLSAGCAHPPVWLAETMNRLRSEWHPALSVGQVARQAGVHPVYLARCVRRWYGTGLGEELRRLRLLSAARAIATAPATIARIAHSTGFADEPHLSREFRRSVGMTPGRYRALVGTIPWRWRGGR